MIDLNGYTGQTWAEGSEHLKYHHLSYFDLQTLDSLHPYLFGMSVCMVYYKLKSLLHHLLRSVQECGILVILYSNHY